jgi:hypothetical protein
VTPLPQSTYVTGGLTPGKTTPVFGYELLAPKAYTYVSAHVDHGLSPGGGRTPLLRVVPYARPFGQKGDSEEKGGNGAAINYSRNTRSVNYIIAKVCHEMDAPYHLALYGIMQLMLNPRYRKGDDQQVDFIFDEQGKQIGRAMESWRFWPDAAPPFATQLADAGQTGPRSDLTTMLDRRSLH